MEVDGSFRLWLSDNHTELQAPTTLPRRLKNMEVVLRLIPPPGQEVSEDLVSSLSGAEGSSDGAATADASGGNTGPIHGQPRDILMVISLAEAETLRRALHVGEDNIAALTSEVLSGAVVP